MDGLENLKTRMNYYGGRIQENRMINDKLRSLKKALLYSYQACTVALMDENGEFTDNSKRFRALINPDKNKPDYDDKILSIPYEDICLNERPGGNKTSQGLTPIDLRPGNVFEWVETKTKWIIYLQFLEEDAYFRAEIRRCDQQAEIDGKKYWVYIRGPMETTIQWNQKGGIEWNDLNYSLVMYVTRNEQTMNYFHRFKTIKVEEPVTGNSKTWQVVGTNPYYGDGIIQVNLEEYFENPIEEEQKKEDATKPSPQPPDPSSIYIDGPSAVFGYDEISYSIVNAPQGAIEWRAVLDGVEYTPQTAQNQENFGEWIVIHKTPKLMLQQENSCSVKVKINISKGSFTLFCKYNNEEIQKEVLIKS